MQEASVVARFTCDRSVDRAFVQARRVLPHPASDTSASHAPKARRPGPSSSRRPSRCRSPRRRPARLSARPLLRRVNARSAAVSSTRSAANSVVTSQPSQRSADEMSAASFSRFGRRPMWVDLRGDDRCPVGVRAVGPHQRHPAGCRRNRRRHDQDERQQRNDEQPRRLQAVDLQAGDRCWAHISLCLLSQTTRRQKPNSPI